MILVAAYANDTGQKGYPTMRPLDSPNGDDLKDPRTWRDVIPSTETRRLRLVVMGWLGKYWESLTNQNSVGIEDKQKLRQRRQKEWVLLGLFEEVATGNVPRGCMPKRT